MNFTPKRLLTITLVLFISLGLVWTAWAMSQKDSVLVFESEGGFLLLEAKPGNRDKIQSSNWKKDLLARQSATITRTNYTNDTARELLAEYMKAKNNNTEINEDALIASILEKNSPEKIQEEINSTEYKISDLKITSKNDKDSLKKYGNEIGETSAKNVTESEQGNVLDVITRAAVSNNENDLNGLNPIIKSYRNMVSDLLKIEVPSEIVDQHLSIINSFSEVSVITENFKNFLSDPVRGIFMLSNFARAGLDVQQSFKELDKYFKSKDVHFDETEYGFLIERTANFRLEDA